MLAVPTNHAALPETHQEPVRANISWLFGLHRGARQDPLHFFLRVTDGQDVTEFPNPLGRFYLIREPDLIAQILRGKHSTFQKSEYYNRVRPLFGDGLFELEGESWRRKRQLMQPAFHKGRIEALATLMMGRIALLLNEWERASATNQPIDIVPSLMHTTFGIIVQSLCGRTFCGDLNALSDALSVILREGERLLWSPFPAIYSVPSPRRSRVNQAIQLFDAMIQQLIDAHIEGHENSDTTNLLAELLAARDQETGRALTRRELRDDLMTMLIAGHETTALAIAWACYLLSKHPEVLQELRAENVRVLSNRLPTLSDLGAMPVNLNVIQETLRLYPPFWTLSRQPTSDTTLGPYQIPAKSTLMVSPYVTHRDPRLWRNPEAFDPKRFLVEESAGRHPFSYFPFGAGPRVCIGRNMALLEAQLCLSSIVQRYDLELAPGYRVEPQPMISLRPKSGIVMYVRKVTGPRI